MAGDRQYIRVSAPLMGMSGAEIREAAEYAIGVGWKAGEPVGSLLSNLLRCIPDLEIQIKEEWYPAFVAPAEEHGYEPCVFIGTVEDNERELMGTLDDYVGLLRVLRNF